MKFACMSCAAKYSVPDGRLAASGPAGLRVRCSRCRAIMVVASTQGEASRVDGPFHSDQPIDGASLESLDATSDQGPLIAETRGGGMAMPAALSASGVFRAVPGVSRQVTGLFFPELDQLLVEGKPTSSRVWYAAVDKRPRGPFSASEMLLLAERGKIRDATLVWRPGFLSWKKVRHGEASTNEDLSWLRKVVFARKLREMEAQERAHDRLGIAPVQMVRTSAGTNRPSLTSSWQGGASGLPPALPTDATDELPALSLDHHRVAPLDPRAWRDDEVLGLAIKKNALGTRRANRSSLVAMAALAIALVIALASVSLASVSLAAVAPVGPSTVGVGETLDGCASSVPMLAP